MNIIVGVLAFLALAFLIVAIVMIVLYANEKDKTVYPEVKPNMLRAQPYYISFIDYNNTYNATVGPSQSEKDHYKTQIENAAREVYASDNTYWIGHTSLDMVSQPIPEDDSPNFRVVISATVVVVRIGSATKSSRQKRQVDDGFPSLEQLSNAIGDKIGPKTSVFSTFDSTMNVCGSFNEPTAVPNPPASTTAVTPGSTVSGATAPATTKKTTAAATTVVLSTTPNPCPTSTICPACPPTQTPLTTPTTTSCPPSPPPPVCSTVPPVTTECPACTCSTPAPTTPNPHTTLPTRSTVTIATTTPVPPDIRCKLDLIFIVDESESVGSGPIGHVNFQLIKKALKETTNASLVKISQADTRMAWVGYSTIVNEDPGQVQFLVGALSNEQTYAAVDNLLFYPGGSNTTAAFNYTRDVLLTKENGARPDDEKVIKELIILISDGNYDTWDKPDPAYKVAQQLRHDNTKLDIYAVAVAEDGHGVDFANLDLITGDPSHTINIANYTQLEATIARILNQTCGTPPTSPPPSNCKGDLILVVDKSESVGGDNFTTLQTFLQDFIDKFPVVGDSRYRIALVTFDTTVKIEFNLDKYTNNKDIRDAIGRLEYYKPTATNTSGALETVLRDVMRPASCFGTFVILFTDGIHDIGGDPAIPAENIRKKATIVTVGIGPLVNRDELVSIAGFDDAQHVYTYDEFSHLNDTFANYVEGQTCKPNRVLDICNNPHDVAFVVDLHKELTEIEFTNVKNYLKYLSSGFYWDNGGMHLSLVTYGSEVVSSTSLQSWTRTGLTTYIDSLQRDSKSGDPSAALAAALQLLNNTIYNSADDRDDFYFPDTIIIITTQPTDDSADLQYWADQLLIDQYGEILGIAAGDAESTTADVLGYIARSPDNVVEFVDLTQFESETCQNNNLTQHIINVVCNFYPPAPPPPTQCYTVCSDTSPAPTTTYSPTTTSRPPWPTRPTRTTATTTVPQLLRMSRDGQRGI